MNKTAGQRPFSVSARCLDRLISSQPVDHLHPVLDFAHRLRERLASVAKAPLWSMTPEDKREALTTLAQAEAQFDALEAAPVGGGRAFQVPPPRPVPGLLRTGWRPKCAKSAATPAPTSASPRLWSATTCSSAAMAEGRVTPPRLAPSWPRSTSSPPSGVRRRAPSSVAAETHLVALAEHHDAKALRILGGRIFEVSPPTWPRSSTAKPSRPRKRSAAAHDVDHVGGRRRHLPRALSHPPIARADAARR